jgi:Uncharacterized protein conserved in bacteria (DUF2219)
MFKHILTICLFFQVFPLFAQSQSPIFKHHSLSANAPIVKDSALPALFAAQNPFRKLYYGGSFGFDFSNGWLLEISPLVGYKVGNGFSLGANASFRYLSAVLMSKYGQSYNSTNFTGSAGVFARKKLNAHFFAQAEAAMVLYDMPMYDGRLVRLNAENKTAAEREWQPALPLGMGFTSGDRTSFNIIALYDVLYQDGTPKPSAWTLRMGFEHRF